MIEQTPENDTHSVFPGVSPVLRVVAVDGNSFYPCQPPYQNVKHHEKGILGIKPEDVIFSVFQNPVKFLVMPQEIFAPSCKVVCFCTEVIHFLFIYPLIGDDSTRIKFHARAQQHKKHFFNAAHAKGSAYCKDFWMFISQGLFHIYSQAPS